MSDAEAPNSVPAAEPTLDQARAELDAIDERLLALLSERGALAARIAAAKGGSGLVSPLRPAREIAVLRRLIGRAPANVEAALIVEVWRALIGDNTRRQKVIEIYVGGSPDPVRHFDLARRHFGANARLHRADDARTTLARMLETPAAVGVLPFPGKTGLGMWWPILAERRFHDAVLFGALPARGDGEPEGALLGVGVPLEETGGDQSLAIAFDPHFRLARALNEAQIPGVEHARANATVLVRFNGFVSPQDPRLHALTRAGLDGLRIVGAYARV